MSGQNGTGNGSRWRSTHKHHPERWPAPFGRGPDGWPLVGCLRPSCGAPVPWIKRAGKLILPSAYYPLKYCGVTCSLLAQRAGFFPPRRLSPIDLYRAEPALPSPISPAWPSRDEVRWCPHCHASRANLRVVGTGLSCFQCGTLIFTQEVDVEMEAAILCGRMEKPS